jgi:polyribonucleotide nucleotidyltransferase
MVSTSSTRPSSSARRAKLDLIVVGSKDGLVMVEAGAKEVTEEQVVTALDDAHAAIKQIVAVIDDLATECGKKKLVVAKKESPETSTRDRGQGLRAARQGDADQGKARELRDGRLDAEEPDRPAPEETEAEKKADAKAIFKELKEKVLREEVLTNGVRLDGRKFDEIRNIWIETGVLPRTHGSAVFTRGETQALVTCTLGTADDAQKIESFEGETWKSFMLHYNFPPFSVGETGRMTGPGAAKSATARWRAFAGVADAR